VIVAHAVHYLVAAPAAVVLLAIAAATLVESRRARLRGVAVLREDAPEGDDQARAVAVDANRSSDAPSEP
jgi:hypothetical protein